MKTIWRDDYNINYKNKTIIAKMKSNLNMKPNQKPNTKPIAKSNSKPVVKSNPTKKEPIISPEFPKTLNTYLGPKGYTIHKNELTEYQLNILTKMLMARPLTPGVCFGPASPEYPIYRESDKKIYVPRFFGEKEFGMPKKMNIGEGDAINVPFNGQLRENQIPVVESYLNHVEKHSFGGGGLLDLPCAFGKCLGIDTPILMYNGSIKMVQDVEIGDLLMGDDSTPRVVLNLARGREKMYRVKYETGSYIVNESHILSLKTRDSPNENPLTNDMVNSIPLVNDIPLVNYLSIPKDQREKYQGYRVPIEYKEQHISVDPFFIGLLLADTNNLFCFTLNNNRCVLRYQVPNVGIYWYLKLKYSDYIVESTFETSIDFDYNFFRINAFEKYNLWSQSFIPEQYKINSREVRLTLLQGIIEALAVIENYTIKIKAGKKPNTWINDIISLARSLGFHSYVENLTTICIHVSREEIRILDYAKHKHLPSKKEVDPLLKYNIEVEELDVDDYYGFTIDGNHRFVLGDYSVTHNTSLSLNIISRLGKKALVIVNKEFLLNQWVERIGQFLPTARVGTIQGPTIDIENKDIVIGMLQSISMKDYDSDVFKSFGITIIDEVHHISSEVFSRALFKIVTKYMLGLSATMDRKDGTTHVFKMFLGDVVYKGVRDEEHDVEVRAIEYVTNDAEFNKVELDFRGNPKYSTMIVKLCEYNRRSEFIVGVLHDMIREQPASQIMILAHNRSLLTYLHDAIQHRGFATCGYYVGGMKEESLKETESKQIVIATYAMAAEALDIKTLSSLIMVTPKTDIVQSVGRILRVRHEKPIVVDIVDSHDLFHKQWIQRRRFYKKCNYKIKMINSNDYYGMDIDWNQDKKWKMVFDPHKIRCKKTEPESDDEPEEDDKPNVKPCLIQIDGLIDVTN